MTHCFHFSLLGSAADENDILELNNTNTNYWLKINITNILDDFHGVY